MSQPVGAFQKFDLFDGREAQRKLDFSTLYDRYAPALLGVITQIVTDKTEAVGLLEQTFIKVRSELSQCKPEQKPLFAWLLGIARCTALEAVRQRKQSPTPVFKLTSTGQVVVLPTRIIASQPSLCTDGVNANWKEFLDAVLFNNCTPEEAAVTVGIPAETARQQLRLAMQQLRSQTKV